LVGPKSPLPCEANDGSGSRLCENAFVDYAVSLTILGSSQDGITTLVPKPLTSNSKADGRFDKRDFIYSARRDEYRCPAGERAIWRMTTVENGLTLHRYWSSACPQCPIKAQCTPSPYRRIARWEHEQVLDAMQHRLDRTPEASHYAGKRPSIPSVR